MAYWACAVSEMTAVARNAAAVLNEGISEGYEPESSKIDVEQELYLNYCRHDC